MATALFCLWLAWSRFRVVLPLLDKSAPSVWAAVDVALRRAGGVPAYLLTDNEKTVTVEHVAGIPVRNPGAVEFGRYYGLTVATCVPYDPASKGGSESTVKIAKADLVPTDANLLPEYASFAELEAACLEFCGQVNARPHRITRRAPAEMLAEERARLHPVPAAPFTAALGVTRKADALSLVTFEGGQYSVPHELAGQPVWVRRHGEQVVITHAGPAGPAEVARHLVTAPGSPRVDDAHYPPAPPGALNRTPRARTAAEAQFQGIGNGAGLWLAEAAAAGASRVRPRWPRRCSWPRCTALPPPTGRSARPPRRAGSPTGTWPPSSLTRRRLPKASRPGRRPVLAGPGHQRMGTARRDGGSTMTLRAPHHDAVLTSEEIAVIRRALTACSQVLTWAGQHGDQELREMLADVTWAAEGNRSPGGLGLPRQPGHRLPGLRTRRPEPAVTAAAPAPPPLDAGLEQLLRRMRLPHTICWACRDRAAGPRRPGADPAASRSAQGLVGPAP